MVCTAMEKYEEMKQNIELMSWAEKAEQAEYIQKVSLEESRRKGLEEGVAKGLLEGEAKGKKTMLFALLMKKYGAEEREWLESLFDEQLDTLLENILIYDDFDDLKKAMQI